LIGLTRKIAGDYAAHGITANCVAPGQIATAMASRSSSEVLAAAARDALVGRVGSATEVAETIRFLASQEAAYITGAVVDVNGGAFIG
jgi:3-oxoacyl-[acyl-carrier protein] reductase